MRWRDEVLCVSALPAALPRSFIEQNAGGDGGVEALYRAGHGDSDSRCRAVEHFCGEAAAFVPDEERDWTAEVVGGTGDGFVSGAAARCCRSYGSEDGDMAFGEGGEGLCGFLLHDRNAEGRSGGGAQGFGVPDVDGAGKGDDAAGSKGFRRADQGAEVAGILQSGGDEDERGGVRFSARLRGGGLGGPESFGQREARRLDEGGDALRGFCLDGAVKHRGRELDDGDGGGQREPVQGVEAAAAACRIGANEDSAQTELAAQSLGEEVLALNADDLGGVAGGAGEGGAQFADASVLPTLYNADEARAI